MKPTRDDDLAREIRAHIDLEAEERIADGAAPGEARDAARRAFGNVLTVREDARAVWTPVWVDHALQDLRYALRRLRRAPAFTAVAILVLTVGVGLNLGFFQLLNVAVLQPPRVAGIETLVRFDRVTKRFSSNGFPYPATQFIRQHNDVLGAVLTSSASDVVWGPPDNDTNDRVEALFVSANWFSELGYGAARGRTFIEGTDDRPDAAPGVVVSYDFWQTRLHGQPVEGQVVRVNARPATLLGVAPQGFPGLRLGDTQVWLPIEQMEYFNPGSPFTHDWSAHSTQLYARLRDGITAAAAQAGLRATVAELARIRPSEFEPDEVMQAYEGRTGFRTLRDRTKTRAVALLIGGLMLLVLAVACANLSSLVLSQAISRSREFSVRGAIGAGRWRLVRQQLVETAIVAAAGTACGVLAGYWFARFIAVQTYLPRYLDLSPDWRMIAVACAIAAGVTLVTGFVPAWTVTRRDLLSAIRDGGHQASRSLARGRFRLVLIGSQIAGCCVLLIAAGSMLHGLRQMMATDLGFEFRQIAVLDPLLSRYGIGGEAARAYWTHVKEALASNPDVDRLALASHAPLASSGSRSRYTSAPRLTVTSIVVEPEFFDVLRIPLLAGRSFTPQEHDAPVVVVSRRLALEMYGSLDVIGRGFPVSSADRTIVGVAADAPLIYATATNMAEIYRPAGLRNLGDLKLLARARADPARLLLPLRESAQRADGRVLPRVSLARSRYEERLHGSRLMSLIAGLTSALALALVCVGVFGLVAQDVAMRTKEIGIRRALGAGGASIVRTLVRQLSTPIALGTAVGILAGLALTRALEAEPFYLPETNALIPAIALAILAVTTAAATFRPASRAVGTDPLRALRQD
jgi:predicted permease